MPPMARYASALARIAALQATAPRPEPWMIQRAQLLARAGQPGAARRAWSEFLAHVEHLPNLERGSREMREHVELARRALAALPK